MIKVKMLPHAANLGSATSGIARVVEAYFKYLPEFGVELVGPDATSFDLLAAHAGATGSDCDVCHCHGLHWTSDDECSMWQYQVNRKVIDAIRNAKIVTVPSPWVAETLRRDMRLNPYVVPHGIDWDLWQRDVTRSDYILWNKNRDRDVCHTDPLFELAQRYPKGQFVSTFGAEGMPNNIAVTGVVSHPEMKNIVQQAGVYLATTRETFGIGILEAMASGVPILGYAHGGILDIVEHEVSGYLAQPNNISDLLAGLHYCIQHNRVLGENGREMAKRWTWQNAVRQIAEAYTAALQPEEPTAAIIIPSYNYGELVNFAIQSAVEQTYPLLKDIIVVDDGSQEGDRTKEVTDAWSKKDPRVRYIRQRNKGVAIARNTGIANTTAKYITCLDADDAIKKNFLATLIPPLEQDRTIGITYSGLKWIRGDKTLPSRGWPIQSDYNQQIRGRNQVPTCCVFRRDAWERLGGYRQRYAPHGCGAEDAEFWLRVGALGYHARMITNEQLFIYNAGGYTSTNRDYREPNWLAWHPWTRDDRHPFASIATPHHHSHPVRRYDEPLVSVIIPVGPGHERTVIQALDSLEAQTVRKWEAIVVDDTCDMKLHDVLKDAYPYVHHAWTCPVHFHEDGSMSIAEGSKPKGAGYSRNMGVKVFPACAPFLLFLDADDWLLPNALEEMLNMFGENEAIIYSESMGIRAASPEDADKYKMRNELVNYEEGILTVRQSVGEYNYQLAVQQPYTRQPYFWCYISSLVPRIWHEEIGGFDEKLETWEDWDYWIRLAKAGKPFVPVHRVLMVYNYDTGHRREYGRTIKQPMMDKLRKKHKEIKTMGCKGCGKSPRVPPPRPSRLPTTRGTVSTVESEGSSMADKNFVMCRFVKPQAGSHGIVGVQVFTNRVFDKMRKVRNGWVIDYGYHSPGDVFLVHVKDAQALPGWFTRVEQSAAERIVKVPTGTPRKPVAPSSLKEVAPQRPHRVQKPAGSLATDIDAVVKKLSEELSKPEPVETAAPEPTPVKEFDLQLVPGVSDSIKEKLLEHGYSTPQAILAGGADGLQKVNGIGAAKARFLMDAARAYLDANRDMYEEEIELRRVADELATATELSEMREAEAETKVNVASLRDDVMAAMAVTAL